ncbi:MAG: oligosaccharide flippase family protein [Nitrospirae bacterium]|nr:oligosaccharide flippase family protein [Nitrospirota bacterium]
MNLAKESFYTLVFQISGFICATVAGIIIARALGPSNKGIVAIALLYPSFFFTIFNLTFGLSIMHHMGKMEYGVKTFSGSALIILIAMSVLSMSVFFVTVGLFRETLYKGIEIKYLTITGISVPFYLMLYYFSSILQGSMDIKGYNISNQLSSFSNLFFILIFIFLWRFTALEAVIAGISGIVLGGVFSLCKAIKRAGGISFNKKLAGVLIKDGAKIHLGAIATFIFNQASFFILNYYAVPSEVGYYSVAFSLANIIFFFSISLEIGLYPKMAHATMEEAVELIQVATRQILLITALAALIMAAFSKYIVLIYGGEAFLPSVTPLILLLPGVVMFVIPKILSTLWVRKGWFLPLTFIATGMAVLSLILNLLLISGFGAKGAAIATTMTYALSSFIGLLLYWKYISRDISSLFIPKRADFTIYREILAVFKR